MKDNKSNTLLLTVIGVATLLVAVIGATFAYFTANGSGSESVSTVRIGAGTLNIQFSDGNAALTFANNTPSSTVAMGSKEFTLTGNNDTAVAMPYNVYLEVTANEFTGIDYDGDTVVALGSGTHEDFVRATLAPQEGQYVSGMISSTVVEKDILPGTHTVASAIPFGEGSFAAQTTGVNHKYVLKIYFDENGKNQDDEKGKSMTCYVRVDGKAI